MSAAATTATRPLRDRRTRPSLVRPTRPGALLVATGISLVALGVAVVGLATGGSLITGAPAWLKPLKFAVSIAIYCATLAWLLTRVEGHPRLVRAVAWVTGVALVGELVLIGTQVVRGTTSHFNLSSTFDRLLFDAMGGLVALVFLAALATAVLLSRQRGLPPVLASGIRGGLFVSLLGMAEAGLMLANVSISPGGAHTVGAPDGGPGLPLTGWSTQHGDLRVAHFVGLHALQALPILAWALSRYATRLTEVAQVRLVRLSTISCAGLVGLLAWQAMRGLPLLRPDAAVLTVAAVGAGMVGLVAAVIVRRGVRA